MSEVVDADRLLAERIMAFETEHGAEYLAAVKALTPRGKRSGTKHVVEHWEIGRLFVRYSDSPAAIARDTGWNRSYVCEHTLVAGRITTRAALDRTLTDNPVLTSFSKLVIWCRSGGTRIQRSFNPLTRWPKHLVEAVREWGLEPYTVLPALRELMTVEELRYLLTRLGFKIPDSGKESSHGR